MVYTAVSCNQNIKKSFRNINTHTNVMGVYGAISCNNVAPVTNLCLGRATTRSHSSQWSKKKVAVET